MSNNYFFRQARLFNICFCCDFNFLFYCKCSINLLKSLFLCNSSHLFKFYLNISFYLSKLCEFFSYLYIPQASILSLVCLKVTILFLKANIFLNFTNTYFLLNNSKVYDTFCYILIAYSSCYAQIYYLISLFIFFIYSLFDRAFHTFLIKFC